MSMTGLQWIAVYCSMLQCVHKCGIGVPGLSPVWNDHVEMLYTYLSFSLSLSLQLTESSECVAVFLWDKARTATQCNMLQHTATQAMQDTFEHPTMRLCLAHTNTHIHIPPSHTRTHLSTHITTHLHTHTHFACADKQKTFAMYRVLFITCVLPLPFPPPPSSKNADERDSLV